MSELAGHESFVQAIPAWLGFVPDDVLLVALFDDESRVKEMVLVESDAGEDYFAGLHAELARRKAHSVALVSIAPDPKELLQRALQSICLPVRFMVCMALFEPGEPMIELVTKVGSWVPDYRLSEAAAARVYDGKPIFASRDELRRTYDPIDPPISNRRISNVAAALSSLEETIQCGFTIDFRVIGGLLIRSKAVRTKLLHCIDVEPQNSYALFTAAAQRLRGPARMHALTAAGIAALRSGELEFARAAAKTGLAEFEGSGTRTSDLHMLDGLVRLGIVPDQVDEFWTHHPPIGSKPPF